MPAGDYSIDAALDYGETDTLETTFQVGVPGLIAPPPPPPRPTAALPGPTQTTPGAANQNDALPAGASASQAAPTQTSGTGAESTGETGISDSGEPPAAGEEGTPAPEEDQGGGFSCSASESGGPIVSGDTAAFGLLMGFVFWRRRRPGRLPK